MGQVTFKLEGKEAGAVRSFLRVVDAQRKAARGQDTLNRKSKQGTAAVRRMGKSAIRDLTGMAAGVVSVGGAIAIARKAWNLWREDIANSVRSMKEFQTSFIDLQFLGDFFKDPKLRKRIHAKAAAEGVDAGELAKGTYALKSMTAYATDAKREDYLNALIKMRKTSSLTIPEFVPMFAKTGAIYRSLSGQELSNLTHYLIDQASVANLQELATQAPKMMAAGVVGNIDARTAAAIGAFMTAKTGTPAQAAGAMRIMLRKVMLADPDAQEAIRSLAFGRKTKGSGRVEIMKAAGVADADNAYQRLLKLSAYNKKTPLSVQNIKDVFGERALGYAKVLLADPEGLKAMVQRFKTKTAKGIDMVGGKLAAVEQTDPIFRYTRAGAKLDARVQAARQRPDNLVWDNLAKAVQAIREERHRGDWFWKTETVANVGMARFRTALTGEDPVQAATTLLARILLREGMTGPAAMAKAQEDLGVNAKEFKDAVWIFTKAAEKLEKAADNLNRTSDKTTPAIVNPE